ncbi:MAG: fused MFS/spermidine synthase [Verrucomicrobiota bacterium]
MAGLFACALFCSAALLFWVQPMVAKLLLPLQGGTPTVWNVCMVFFQALLLAGYAYSHWMATRLQLRTQVRVQLILLAANFLFLPVALSAAARAIDPWRIHPIAWLLLALLTTVGLPFFTLSTLGPLTQSWFSRSRQKSSGDPYFLYAASNLGSLVGLLAYPAFLEPVFPLRQQGRLWTAGYALLVVLVAACAWTALSANRNSIPPGAAPDCEPAQESEEEFEAQWLQRGRWIFQAFIPSGLMLGVTSYISTDIASVPLLWVIPLALYLLSFVIVFSRKGDGIPRIAARILPAWAVVLLFVTLSNAENLAWLQMGVHLGFFFVAALVWHGRLAAGRPPAVRLTEFYFCLSTGGVLGGIFNALAAPLLFRGVAEYPILIVLACLLPASGRLLPGARRPRVAGEILLAAVVGLLTWSLVRFVPVLGLPLQVQTAFVFGVPCILCYLASKGLARFQFALCLGSVFLASLSYTAFRGTTLHTERNFFGTLRIALEPGARIRRLYHGTTVHGMQFVQPDRQDEPLAYYHPTGACGQAMKLIHEAGQGTHIGAIGLGAGSMICYAQPGQRWTFYEINPAVIALASDTNYFTFLSRNTNAVVDFAVGDARLRLREAPAGEFRLLVCDAFGSDAPPLHLMTREAMQLYLDKLAPGGVMLFHVSSRSLDFRPVLGNLAHEFNLTALVNCEPEQLAGTALPEGRYPSTWVAMARRPEDLSALLKHPSWRPLEPAPRHALWTDDYSNILRIFQWD